VGDLKSRHFALNFSFDLNTDILCPDRLGTKNIVGKTGRRKNGTEFAGREKFTFDGNQFLVTMERRGHPSGLPDLEDAGLLKFCFKLEADRSRFVTALELLGCHPLEPLAAAVPMAAAAAAAASASAMATSSSSFALYYTKTDHFTKTGSGQT
jgi:hypothetical protein